MADQDAGPVTAYESKAELNQLPASRTQLVDTHIAGLAAKESGIIPNLAVALGCADPRATDGVQFGVQIADNVIAAVFEIYAATVLDLPPVLRR